MLLCRRPIRFFHPAALPCQTVPTALAAPSLRPTFLPEDNISVHETIVQSPEIRLQLPHQHPRDPPAATLLMLPRPLLILGLVKASEEAPQAAKTAMRLPAHHPPPRVRRPQILKLEARQPPLGVLDARLQLQVRPVQQHARPPADVAVLRPRLHAPVHARAVHERLAPPLRPPHLDVFAPRQ